VYNVYGFCLCFLYWNKHYTNAYCIVCTKYGIGVAKDCRMYGLLDRFFITRSIHRYSKVTGGVIFTERNVGYLELIHECRVMRKPALMTVCFCIFPVYQTALNKYWKIHVAISYWSLDMSIWIRTLLWNMNLIPKHHRKTMTSQKSFLNLNDVLKILKPKN